jgi:hypothetical protein
MRSNLKRSCIISGLVLGGGMLFACPTPVPKLSPVILPINKSSVAAVDYYDPKEDDDTYVQVGTPTIAITSISPYSGGTVQGDGFTINWTQPGVYDVEVTITATWDDTSKNPAQRYTTTGSKVFEVTVVKAEIKATDGESAPVKVIPVSKQAQYKCVVTPEVSGTYAWSSSSTKIALPPDASSQTVTVSAGANPSAAMDAEALQLIFTPSDAQACDPVSLSLTVIKLATATAVPLADSTRTKIGVGEKVFLAFEPSTLNPDSWSVQGAPVEYLQNDEDGEFFIAPETGCNPVVTATYGGVPCSVTFTVVPPEKILFTRSSSLNGNYTAGMAGCGMLSQLTFYPTDVSFGNVEWLEDKGPASNVFGYFTNNPPFTAGMLDHAPNANWVSLSNDNQLSGGGADEDKFARSFGNDVGGDPAWSDGGWDWNIPNRYRLNQSLPIQNLRATGFVFVNTTELFRIFASGYTTVTKQGLSPAAFVDRTP